MRWEGQLYWKFQDNTRYPQVELLLKTEKLVMLLFGLWKGAKNWAKPHTFIPDLLFRRAPICKSVVRRAWGSTPDLEVFEC